ncbi:MAG: N-formylglutamate deformylase [Gammaproteobacteria bacterium]|nr:N-formylglutamate deformylase [Gammaproteobacteria bacterium]MBT8093809.1 N-formylglutamate deformylase [Gammaproteobacteria bacterium]NNL64208.1 N-formylglutamate deformylase [Woeseiaceae bacterium]
MSEVFTFHEGCSPLLVSVPHDGRDLPRDLRGRMTVAGLALGDTDWHVARLYDFVRDLGANLLVARYSRYVVDLNRPADDAALYAGQVATGLCPSSTFAGEAIYEDGPIGPDETARRVCDYWQPYHDKLAATLAALKARHGYALLWDAHSIASVVPRLFDGKLPALNIGTYGGRSCAEPLAAAVTARAARSPYSHVRDGRFQGGFITRRYGEPAKHVHAVQLEIAQRVYMDESSGTYDAQKASQLRDTLRRMLETLIKTATKS